MLEEYGDEFNSHKVACHHVKIKKKIVLTGGGTLGHVIPHITIITKLQDNNWEITYIGSSGIEKNYVKKYRITYRTILVGKLRRYFSWKILQMCLKFS